MKSCIDCSHLKARIPLLHTSNSILRARLLYDKAVAKCTEGYLTTIQNKKEKDKIFKNILKTKDLRKLQTFDAAERCPEFDPMFGPM
jgi:hypothetical protein